MTRDHIFWIIFGVVSLALIACHFIWGGHVRSQAEAEKARWVEMVSQYGQLNSAKASIPNRESIKKWDDFKKWTKDQTADVVSYFDRRDKVIERRLVEGVQDPAPGDFKAAYNSIRSESVRRLKALMQMRVWNPEAVFKEYPWSVGAANPAPSEYRPVTKDLWIRRYFVLGVLPRHGVVEVSDLSVLPAQRLPDSEFSAAPVRIRCQVPAENVVQLLRSLIVVEPGDPEKLFVLLREFSVRKGVGVGGQVSPPVLVDLLADVLDFDPKS